jgi:hypothetical protein
MTVKAPSITSLTIAKLSATSVSLKWDEVGENFYYFVEVAKTREPGNISWQSLGYTSDNFWFSSDLAKLTYYKFSILICFQYLATQICIFSNR